MIWNPIFLLENTLKERLIKFKNLINKLVTYIQILIKIFSPVES